jgi:hypothetical protein
MAAATAASRLYSVETGTSAQTVAKMLRVLFPDAATVLDATWGTGRFWDGSATVRVTGLDISPHGRPAVMGDFTRLPFRDQSFDAVIFDPPYLTDVSKAGTSQMGRRFGAYGSDSEIEDSIAAGCREAWRVARLGVIVKVSQHTHESRFVDMQGWVRDALGQALYGQVEQVRQSSKMVGANWSADAQLSVWCNSATFMAFRHGDQRHIRRRAKLDGLAHIRATGAGR